MIFIIRQTGSFEHEAIPKCERSVRNESGAAWLSSHKNEFDGGKKGGNRITFLFSPLIRSSQSIFLFVRALGSTSDGLWWEVGSSSKSSG